MQPLVSVIVVNYNGKDNLRECLLSLKSQTYKSLEIIVVDNGSIDGSGEMLDREFAPLVRVLRSEVNHGFAKGNNLGIQIAHGEYIALINNDATAEPEWIGEMVKTMASEPKVGMVAPKICYYDEHKKIAGLGHVIYPDGLNKGRAGMEEDKGQYERTEEVIYPSACAALYRKEMLNEIGLFDEDFFLCGEDTDLGLRARLWGWKALYSPKAVVYHKMSATLGLHSPQKAFYVERNRLWVAIKNFPLPLLMASPYFTLKRWLFQGYGALFNHGAPGKFVQQASLAQLLLVLISAYLSAFKGLPKMWKKRRVIMKNKRVSDKEVYEWFKKFGISARQLALRD